MDGDGLAVGAHPPVKMVEFHRMVGRLVGIVEFVIDGWISMCLLAAQLLVRVSIAMQCILAGTRDCTSFP